jgi:hypothetical protein
MRDPVKIVVKPTSVFSVPTEFWWVEECIVARFYTLARQECLQVLRVGAADLETVTFIAQLMVDQEDYDVAAKAAESGLDIQKVRTIWEAEEQDFGRGWELLDQMLATGSQCWGVDLPERFKNAVGNTAGNGA